MRIRPFAPTDRGPVIDLWHRCGLVRPWNDPDRDLDRKLADSPWGMLVGVADPGRRPETRGPSSGPDSGDAAHGSVIASMMVGYDGHRGSVFYLAVDPVHQGRGHGTALMAHAEQLLLARGCPKLHISVRADNAAVIAFYERRGYQLEGADHAVTLGRRLIVDGPGPGQAAAGADA
ncbi:MAG TPA: GNAT family N-acetyltransferase [Candidatus Nanopelagicales bacterium]